MPASEDPRENSEIGSSLPVELKISRSESNPDQTDSARPLRLRSFPNSVDKKSFRPSGPRGIAAFQYDLPNQEQRRLHVSPRLHGGESLDQITEELSRNDTELPNTPFDESYQRQSVWSINTNDPRPAKPGVQRQYEDVPHNGQDSFSTATKQTPNVKHRHPYNEEERFFTDMSSVLV